MKEKITEKLLLIEDGAEALDFINRKNKNEGFVYKPKVIFLDLKLPQMNGLEVLEEIRANKSYERIPVVIVTSSMEDSDIETAYELGVNSFIAKPVDFSEFVATIKEVGTYWLRINQHQQKA
ncbi:MAG: response regulator [Candidatus Zophobacter franzmannii]|nr:response regulator [Candidatus Zophobacter franzmannii]